MSRRTGFGCGRSELLVAHVLLQREIVLFLLVRLTADASAVLGIVAVTGVVALILHAGPRGQLLEESRARHDHVRGNGSDEQRGNLVQTEVVDADHQSHEGERHRHNSRGQGHHETGNAQALGDVIEVLIHDAASDHAHGQEREDNTTAEATVHRHTQKRHACKARANQQLCGDVTVGAVLDQVREDDVTVANGERQRPVHQTDDQATNGGRQQFLQEGDASQAQTHALENLLRNSDGDHDHCAESTSHDTDHDTSADLPAAVSIFQPFNCQL